jgi:hypothetical protein
VLARFFRIVIVEILMVRFGVSFHDGADSTSNSAFYHEIHVLV